MTEPVLNAWIYERGGVWKEFADPVDEYADLRDWKAQLQMVGFAARPIWSFGLSWKFSVDVYLAEKEGLPFKYAVAVDRTNGGEMIYVRDAPSLFQLLRELAPIVLLDSEAEQSRA